MERSTALDFGLDVQDQLLHRGFVVTVADDLEGLNHWNAGREHGCQLPRENCDVFRLDLAAAAHRGALLADPGRRRRPAGAARAQHGLVGREALAFHPVAALVFALPGKGNVALDGLDGSRCCRSHELIVLHHSVVTLLTSSRLVKPDLTFSSPARRRSHTPSFAACSAISTALPAARMMRAMDSVTGRT